MRIQDQITDYYVRPDRCMRGYYLQIVAAKPDIGFRSILKNGKDFHQLTREIALSVNQMHNSHMTNLCFCEGNPIRLELNDTELISYYSDYIELRYILSGHLEVEIENETVYFEENDLSFINSMAYHRESIQHSECMLLNINIDRNVFNEAFLNSIGLSALQKFLRTNILMRGEQQHYLKFTPTSGACTEEMHECISRIFFEVKNHLPGYLDVCKGYIIRLMDQLACNYQYNFNRHDKQIYNEKLFESISEYMTAHMDSISMSELSEKFHFQPNYFNNLIKKFTGLTYSNYLIILRINRAKELLRTTTLSIDEIMWAIGYNNKGFFYKKFREITGISPWEYRNE